MSPRAWRTLVWIALLAYLLWLAVISNRIIEGERIGVLPVAAALIASLLALYCRHRGAER